MTGSHAATIDDDNAAKKPPPELSIGGRVEYSEIGSVLFEPAVEAGIAVVVFAIHRAQHQKLSFPSNWRIGRNVLGLRFIFRRDSLLTKDGHFALGNYGSKAGFFGRIAAPGHDTANDRKR
ncbi:hypothetical protein [Mesorhizobium sp. IMUNJ 23232]|uniref:hypothetical protein n=1 Tax=Mesorhizobium sp. IMUNJ 23232 TaxID=3376064 RepID=UPI003798C151